MYFLSCVFTFFSSSSFPPLCLHFFSTPSQAGRIPSVDASTAIAEASASATLKRSPQHSPFAIAPSTSTSHRGEIAYASFVHGQVVPNGVLVPPAATGSVEDDHGALLLLNNLPGASSATMLLPPAGATKPLSLADLLYRRDEPLPSSLIAARSALAASSAFASAVMAPFDTHLASDYGAKLAGTAASSRYSSSSSSSSFVGIEPSASGSDVGPQSELEPSATGSAHVRPQSELEPSATGSAHVRPQRGNVESSTGIADGEGGADENSDANNISTHHIKGLDVFWDAKKTTSGGSRRASNAADGGAGNGGGSGAPMLFREFLLAREDADAEGGPATATHSDTKGGIVGLTRHVRVGEGNIVQLNN